MYEIVTDINIYLINKIFNVIIVGFEFWCWRRLLKILWTVKKINKWIIKQNREFSLNTQMIKLKWSLQLSGEGRNAENGGKRPAARWMVYYSGDESPLEYLKEQIRDMEKIGLSGG